VRSAAPVKRQYGPPRSGDTPTSGSLLKDYLTEEDAAAAIGVKPKTMREYRRLQIGPPFTIVARQYRYHRPKLRQWLADGGVKET
jgi:hypothetical protein